MFIVTIGKAEKSHPWASFPFLGLYLSTEGSLTPEEAINKTGLCTVNGQCLRPGDRVLVKGTVHESLKAWAHEDNGCKDGKIHCVFIWDGESLTQFPKYDYANYLIDLDQNTVSKIN